MHNVTSIDWGYALSNRVDETSPEGRPQRSFHQLWSWIHKNLKMKRLAVSTCNIQVLAAVLFILFLSLPSLMADEIHAARDLIQRLIPERANEFDFEAIPQENNKDVMEVVSRGDKIVIRGSSTIAMTSGFHWYLKHVAKCHVSWNGDQLNLPKPLPKPDTKINLVTSYKNNFYLNYCTHSYTMAWWDWERWERETTPFLPHVFRPNSFFTDFPLKANS